MTKDEKLTQDCLKVIKGERCKHGMIFEYCGTCQDRTYLKEYKVPIEKIDEETGKKRTIWIRGVSERHWVMRYR